MLAAAGWAHVLHHALALRHLLDDDAGSAPRPRRSAPPRRAPRGRRSPRSRGSARAGGRWSARSPRGASARSARRAGARRGRRPRRRPLPRESFTRMATLPSASLNSRSRIWREVTFLPSRPPSGPSLMRKVMASVGGSTGIGFAAALSTSGAQIVSGMVPASRPAMAMMSPASACSTGTRSRPRKDSSFVRRPVSTTLPSGAQDLHRHVDARDALLDAAGQDAAEEVVGFQDARRHGEGLVASLPGAGTWRSTRSNSAERSCFGPSMLSSAQPWRPEA